MASAMPETVRYELPDPALGAYSWVHEGEHAPASQPPLTRDAFGLARAPAAGPPPRLVINGYTYVRSDAAPPFPDTEVADGRTPLARWRERWLPEVEALISALDGFEPDRVEPGQWSDTLGHQARAFGRVFVGVHGETVLPSARAAEAFVAQYLELFGEGRRDDAYALLQGFPNRTLDRAVDLWDLSRLVRSDAGLRTALGRWPAVPEANPSQRAFREGFQAFLDTYGDTLDMFVQDAPTWGEDPTVPLALIRSYAQRPDGESPREAAAAQRRRREALEAELRGAAASDPAAADLLAALPVAQELLPVREDHNYLCDQRASAASRRRWLKVGRLLMARAGAASPDDVFYYAVGELVTTLEGGAPLSRAEVARRRRLQAAYRAAPPPPVLGKPLPPGTAQDPSGPASSGTRVLRGVGASPGVVRGRARVIRTIGEADRLRPGEVLICGVTAPAWTPYFSLIGALVTDAGGALSHPAVVAREFGLPSVVGTGSATRVIPDGATVTVDGSAGVVTVDAGP